MRNAATYSAFVRAETRAVTPPLVPEVQLRLAHDSHAIFQAAHQFDGDGMRPYWAFAWPGGQALARYIIDNPALVAGKRVLDLGAGSGLAGIAAMLAGARSAMLADVDRLAAAACALNAAANGVNAEVTTNDLLGVETDYDLVIVGDLVYEPELKDRVGTFLTSHHLRGIPMLYGDRTTARRPPGDFRLLADYEAPLTPALLDDFTERARVWQL